jgi:diguanylate cyclase (GGDEF)-like protein
MGGVDYITKPFFLNEVLCRVKTHITIYRNERTLAKEIAAKEQIQAELETANKKLEKLVHLDALTEVANRRHFDEHLFKEWYRLKREKLPLSLIMADVDYFKSYNDHYGHLVGDDCLKSIAQTIKPLAKRPADLVARYGGEEFGIILPNTPLKGAMDVGEKIHREIIQLAIVHEKSQVSQYVTLSLGVATMIPTHESSYKDLINMADQALFQAKKQGRNRLVRSSESKLKLI